MLVVEEAGQVLEAHILAALVPSSQYFVLAIPYAPDTLDPTVQHLICIGDPEQLRPTLSNFCECRGHGLFSLEAKCRLHR